MANLSSWINPDYLKEEKIAQLKAQFLEQKPFSFLQLPNFFIESKAEALLEAISAEQFHRKDSDLFAFFQTHDLSSTEEELLEEFRSFLCSEEFINYMQKLTNIEIAQKVADLAGTLYQDTDYLLCHDDQLEGRVVAFLLYLSDMQEGEGGSLNLLDNDGKFPTKVVKKLIPQFNTFTFFHVSELSFHEVEEVVVDKQRIAIGGWYHARN